MICPYCGTSCESDTIFCPKCGKVILYQTTPVSGFPLLPEDEMPTGSPIPMAEAESEDSGSPEIPSVDTPHDESTAPEADALPSRDIAPPPRRKPKKTEGSAGKKLRIACVVLSLVTAAALAGTIYMYSSFRSQRVNLSINQTERASAEAEVAALTTQIAGLDAQLETITAERDALALSVTELETTINSIESSVNQSTYDRETAERELTLAQEDIAALSAQITEIQGQLTQAQSDLLAAQESNETLQSSYDELAEAHETAETKLSFYDGYVVFIMVGNKDKYYHKYDCEDFTRRNFIAYNTKLAELEGYTKCPNCG